MGENVIVNPSRLRLTRKTVKLQKLARVLPTLALTFGFNLREERRGVEVEESTCRFHKLNS
jgi:hypothetical protein